MSLSPFIKKLSMVFLFALTVFSALECAQALTISNFIYLLNNPLIKLVINNEKFPCFSLYKNNPIRVIVKYKKDSHISQGNAFWLHTPYGKNIFITNAHVVRSKKLRGQRTVKKIFLKDVRGKRIKAKIIAIKEIRTTIINQQTGLITTIKIADIAILETVKPVPQKFKAIPYTLSFKKTDKPVRLRSFDENNNLLQKCLKTTYEGDIIHLYSNNSWAIEGMSGSPVINTSDQMIGMVTVTGILRNKKTKRRQRIFIQPHKNSDPVSSFKLSQTNRFSDNFWPLYATLTSAKEIQDFVDDTYKNR